MFKTTFLGHQGWLFSTRTTNILVDPLLTDSFGHGGFLGEVYPPRTLDLAAFPAMDAVILTHEHDDHFDLASLHQLERAIPIYLSSRSSTAAGLVLREMGFTVHALAPDAELKIGDLRYHTFCADHRKGRTGDEWDVFPFLLHDAHGHGSFASAVDVQPPERMLARLPQLSRPGLWCFANNVTNAAFQNLHHRGRVLDDDNAASLVASKHYQRIVDSWGRPLATLMCGGGWSFPGERAWMNHNVFPVDSTNVCASLHSKWPQQLFCAVNPGQSFTQVSGALASTAADQAFISTLPPTQWPKRNFVGDAPALTEYRGVCARNLRERSQTCAELIRGLADFAAYLYGTALFAAIHSLATTEALCFALRIDDCERRIVLRCDPSSCGFVEHECTTPTETFLSGIECWADDLLALLKGDIGPSALCYSGNLRTWNQRPEQLRISAYDLWRFCHPLRRPQATGRLYQRLREGLATDVVRIRART